MIERGIAGDWTDSHNACLPRLPFTKYDERYAARVDGRLRLHLALYKPKAILRRKLGQPLQVRTRASHLSSRPVREHGMNVQHPASLYLPHARHQEH
jgi:hypothetical protein